MEWRRKGRERRSEGEDEVERERREKESRREQQKDNDGGEGKSRRYMEEVLMLILNKDFYFLFKHCSILYAVFFFR